MTRAVAAHIVDARLRRRVHASAAWRVPAPEPELHEPVLDRPLTHTEPGSYLPVRSAGLYERAEGPRGYCSGSSRSFSASREFFSFESVFDSIWRTRSRVTPTSEPIASSVIGSSEASP